MKNFIRFLKPEFNADFEKNIFIEFWKVIDSEINNFIRFLDAEFHSDFEKNIFFEFWKDFDSEINFSSNVD